jgi:hypothetical protein
MIQPPSNPVVMVSRHTRDVAAASLLIDQIDDDCPHGRTPLSMNPQDSGVLFQDSFVRRVIGFRRRMMLGGVGGCGSQKESPVLERAGLSQVSSISRTLGLENAKLPKRFNVKYSARRAIFRAGLLAQWFFAGSGANPALG